MSKGVKPERQAGQVTVECMTSIPVILVALILLSLSIRKGLITAPLSARGEEYHRSEALWLLQRADL
ncbi:hypothetical protein A4R35_05515 [Thermogemmatispora tikiterensis]|uniref:Uncharacterized protein n=1 Tax=Thermogemmatispora tikiterensis TaxID=1825093 RepID=A0A328VLB0_9CHLR|nr:hypothetical protein A4R35_05515 [Thermogemmatispora tikiterensis]